jgi:GNAT superfamily N-acetyltransferase
MFELTNALIDDIAFWMEDQGGTIVVNTRTGAVQNLEDESVRWTDDTSGDAPSLDDASSVDDDFVDIPEWTSADGFGLMESFTASLKNPPARKALSAALNRGKGVFRAFKDALAASPEVEKRWFAYKDNALQNAVRLWYEGLCEESAVSKIGGEPEESDELVAEDFHFVTTGSADDGAIVIGAKNASEKEAGKLAAFVDAADKTAADADAFVIKELFVEEEFRGLGLGKALLKRFLDTSGDKAVAIELPAASEAFSRILLREGFSVVITRYERK